MAEAWREAQRRLNLTRHQTQFEIYQLDPVGFGEKVLANIFTDGVKQIMLSVRDNPITIAKSANGVGKSHCAARVAVWWYKCHPNSQVYLVAASPLDNLKRILWGEVMSVVKSHPDLFAEDKLKTLAITRDSRSFIAGLAIPTSGTSEEREAKFSGKHSPHTLFIVDEGDAVPDEVYKGIESCMSGTHERLLILFNPRAQIGPVYMKEYNHQAKIINLSAFEHPNVITGNSVIPGAVSRETTVRRIYQWTRPLVAGEREEAADTFDVPDFLVGATATNVDGTPIPPLEDGKRKIVEPSFSYMVLGQYPAQSAAQLISQDWIENARARYDAYVATYGEVPPAGVQPIIGLDVAEFGTDYNVACMRYGGFIAKFIFWQGLDADATTTKALHLYHDKNASMINVDGTGIGASIAPALARRGRTEHLRAISIKTANKPLPHVKSDLGEFHILRDQMWWIVREWLRVDPGAMLPPDRMLMEELKNPTYEVKSDGKIWVKDKEIMRDELRRSPDRADALCLAFAPFTKAKVLRLM